MSYASWSVIFGEQPSAAKWNILGTNDASFNDGTGIGTNAIAAASLATSAIKLGQTTVTSDSASLSNTSVAEVAAFATTVTIPSGGRDVEIEVVTPRITGGTTMNWWMSIWKTAVGGGGTQLQEAEFTCPASAESFGMITKAIDLAPSPGSVTYRVGFRVSTNGATISSSSTAPSYLIVKAI